MQLRKELLPLFLALGQMPLQAQCQYWSPSILKDTGVVLDTQNVSAPSFIGSPAEKQPLQPKTRFSPDVVGFHQDGGNSRTNDWDGPLGNSPQVNSRSVSVSVQFWHDDGRFTARTVCGNITSAHFCIAAFDPDTFDVLGTWAPEGQTLLTPYGTSKNHSIAVSTFEGHIFVVERVDDENGTSFQELRDIDVAPELPQGYSLSTSYFDEDGNIWFAANYLSATGSIAGSSLIGYASESGVIRTLEVANQTFENAIAVNGKTAYVNSGPLIQGGSGQMSAYQAGANGDIVSVWTEEYSAGSGVNPGGFARGSGSSPSLVGSKYVAMTDNEDVQINLNVYRQVEDYQKNVPEGGSSLVCQVPLFKPNASANENAMVGYFDGSTYSVIMNNHHGSPEMQGALNDTTINDLFNDYSPLAPGISRVDITEDGQCETKWTLDVQSTSVLSLSTKNGLVYTYTQDAELAAEGLYVWYFTAIDFRTGEIVWKVRSGAGGNYNNNVSPTQIAPNGGLYQIITGGITWLKDS